MSLHCDTAQHPTPLISHPQITIGGFIIDGQGREVAITEEMIQQACAALEDCRQASQSLTGTVDAITAAAPVSAPVN